MKEMPLTPEMVDKLTELRLKYTSKRRYEWAVQRVWAGVPDSYLNPIFDNDIEERVVYEMDPISGSVDKTPIDFNNERLFKLTNNITEVINRGYNFLFYGANGSGKTFSAIYILSAAIGAGLTGYYIHLKDLYNLYNEVHYSQPDKLKEDLYRYIVSADYLVVDEVGKESLSAPAIAFIESLLKTRATSLSCTIICSNIDLRQGQMLERYGNSVWDIVRGSYFVFHFSSKGDFRKKFRAKWDL